MPRNAAGVYSLPEPPVVPDTTIEAAPENSTRDDIAAEITSSLDRSGRGGMLSPLRLADGTLALPALSFVLDQDIGIYRSAANTWHLVSNAASVLDISAAQLSVPTGVKLLLVDAASVLTQGVRAKDILDNILQYAGTAGGTADALTLATTPAFTAYVEGMEFIFKSSASPNTGAATLQMNGIASPKAIQHNGSALTAGQIAASKLYRVVYDGTAFQLSRADPLIDVARLTVEDQVLIGGVIVTSKDLGTISSGTVTPDPGDRPQQHYTNGGAHTLAPSSNVGSYMVDITNNGSAGAIATSGWTFVTGDLFTTTNGHKFRCHCSIGNAGSLLSVQAMQ